MPKSTEQIIDCIQKIIEQLLPNLSGGSPNNIRDRISASMDITSPVTGWKNAGIILHTVQSYGTPLYLQKIKFDDFFNDSRSHRLPILTSIYYRDEIRDIFLHKVKSNSVYVEFVDTNEHKQFEKNEFILAVNSIHHSETNDTTLIEDILVKLHNDSIPNSDIETFIDNYGKKELLRVYRYVLTLSVNKETRINFLRMLLVEANLWSSLAPTVNTEEPLSEIDSFFVISSEESADFLSDSMHEPDSHFHSQTNTHLEQETSFFRIFSLRPVNKLLRLISIERKDIMVLTGYSMLVSILSLITPLAIDTLVQTITAGLVSFPLIVLTAFVFFGLLIAGGLTLIQQYVVEVLQQRIFVNTSFEIAQKLPHAKTEVFHEEYAPELVNRFFDVVTLQKTFSRLLLDGISAVLIGVSAIFLLALFSPLLLGLGLGLLIISIVVILLSGRGGLYTSIHESHEKYLVAAALEEVGRCLTSYKIIASPSFLHNKLNTLLVKYIYYRKSHFSVIMRQQVSAVIMKVIIVTVILAAGGYLVIERQISLGQLVASQIVILYLIAAVENLFKQLENSYDLLTSLEKLSQITDLEQERLDGIAIPNREAGAQISVKNIVFSYGSGRLLTGTDLIIEAGDRFCLVGKSGEGKSTIAHLLAGLNESYTGTILIDEFDIRTINLVSLRKNIGICLPYEEIIEGTVFENVVMGREWITQKDVINALTTVRLIDQVYSMPKGIQTRIQSYGKNLSTGQQRRLMLARAIVNNPRLLIIDEAFNGIEENIKLQIITELHNPSRAWTIINISHDPDVVSQCEKIGVLADGKISEFGLLKDVSEINGDFRKLFPDLVI